MVYCDEIQPVEVAAMPELASSEGWVSHLAHKAEHMTCYSQEYHMDSNRKSVLLEVPAQFRPNYVF